MTPVIESERLVLRGWRLEDFAAYADFRADAERTRHIGGPVEPFAAWQTFAALSGEWSLNRYGMFAAVEKVSGTVVGYAGLWRPAMLDEPELAWGLYAGFTGRGYAVEAACVARDWAARALGLPPLMSFVHTENLPSLAVARRLGASPMPTTILRGEPRMQFRHVLPA